MIYRERRSGERCDVCTAGPCEPCHNPFTGRLSERPHMHIVWATELPPLDPWFPTMRDAVWS